jgi:hypothetical protein
MAAAQNLLWRQEPFCHDSAWLLLLCLPELQRFEHHYIWTPCQLRAAFFNILKIFEDSEGQRNQSVPIPTLETNKRNCNRIDNDLLQCTRLQISLPIRRIHACWAPISMLSASAEAQLSRIAQIIRDKSHTDQDKSLVQVGFKAVDQ